MIEFGNTKQGEKNRDTFKVRDIPDTEEEKYAFQIIRYRDLSWELASAEGSVTY